jgi:hypothetical protein
MFSNAIIDTALTAPLETEAIKDGGPRARSRLSSEAYAQT